ncbi:hypothetical protein BCON_0298g00150 [Botryotinia convoluta]|uniref:Uncharacterized protein n=1 Tax=Botryotinia convoluta TaxID=54673 RepID=A0A4Z1HDI3_9HELO|nr:hypothetical protein BCON_0298g00150 [Botryotinia convoluta]
MSAFLFRKALNGRTPEVSIYYRGHCNDQAKGEEPKNIRADSEGNSKLSNTNYHLADQLIKPRLGEETTQKLSQILPITSYPGKIRKCACIPTDQYRGCPAEKDAAIQISGFRVMIESSRSNGT